ncbi:ABC-type multidrug transport system, ATPase component [Thermoproteus uzoniensis 768-20]|uniref:ABC-type multidrug transport system, ATPase component n=1 Tax=Thermoproteus uzoniensis (strain 768-20) TaxID=999630 RepID=F2L261_THEU7|nr:ABC transporter ATP-binding protein [Thermoproteus uzoniensis]AEA12988.1 ABC-type multidrug transport system, ATPase component [Thermoproteus uzoniensis 768-20]
MDCIAASGLVKSYGDLRALDGVTFGVPCGGAAALLGPNGAGKSTTLKILAGLLKPDGGRASVGGFEAGSEDARRISGYLPEDPEPYLALTVRENLEYMAALRGVEDWGWVDELVEALELRRYLRYKASSISRGIRQRLAVAMALVHKPQVALLDEPLNYLDVPSQEAVVSLLESLRPTVLVSTHILSVAGRLADEVLIMSGGKIVWRGPLAEVPGARERGLEAAVAEIIRRGP